MSERDDSDLLVLGATPAGIAAAVRSAREGHRTTLVTDENHLGGALPSLGQFESQFDGRRRRAPILDEIKDRVFEHYRREYGRESEQYDDVTHGGFVKFEPHVIEGILEDLVDAESNLDALRRYRLTGVERDGRELHSVSLKAFESDESRRVTADAFVDATYEGDLAATAGVSCRVGRESRREFGEQHAGKLFSDTGGGKYPTEAVNGDLNVAPMEVCTQAIQSGSTGDGDDAVMCYNVRLCLTDDPENRRLPDKPPDYDRDRYLGIVESPEETIGENYPLHSTLLTTEPEEGILGHLFSPFIELPNDKLTYNAGDFVGESWDYPEADWDEREAIAERHLNHVLGLLYFVQNDDEVPRETRETVRRFGLATDEFTDNDNVPRQLYVREARRIEGRHVFTENDARVAADLDRTPIHRDSIAFTTYYLDAHGVSAEQSHGGGQEGRFHLSEITRPAQIPYRSILPSDLDNLLVPVALSATHMGYSCIRLEPTWTHLGEVAGYASALSFDAGTTPGELDGDHLQRRLVENEHAVSFFNEVDASTDGEWVPAVQYLGTKGLFRSYDARPTEPLGSATARIWADTVASIASGDLNANERARELGTDPGDAITVDEFVGHLSGALADNSIEETDLVAICRSVDVDGDERLTRGDACRVLYRTLDEV